MKIQYYGGPLAGQLIEEHIPSAHIGSIILFPEVLSPPHVYRVCHVRDDMTREASYQGIEGQPRTIEQIAGVAR